MSDGQSNDELAKAKKILELIDANFERCDECNCHVKIHVGDLNQVRAFFGKELLKGGGEDE